MTKSARQLHLQIIETLEQRILNGFYKPNEQFPTENQLSVEFDVSRGTMRKALHILETQGVLSRVAGKGTFVNTLEIINNTEQIPPTNLIGIAIPHRSDQLSSNILNGVERVIRDKGYGLVYTNLENHIDTEKEQIIRLKAQRVAGIILFPLAVVGEAQMMCNLIGSTPLVMVDRELTDPCGSVVMADHYSGAYTAVKHLLELGHSRIVVITHPSLASSVKERIRGYEQAMRDANLLPFAPILLLDQGNHPLGTLPAYNDEEMKWVDHMLSIPEHPTAAFCINDNLATGVMRLALSKGLRIPEDFALVSFDNSQFAQFTPVPLSSIEQNAVEMGVKAAELLLRKITNPLEKEQKILLPTHLVVRASTVRVPEN
jgi:GntR family transcriptional regulator, arabinose operon transcriptional repressor